jgi:hypothetical protein
MYAGSPACQPAQRNQRSAHSFNRLSFSLATLPASPIGTRKETKCTNFFSPVPTISETKS